MIFQSKIETTGEKHYIICDFWTIQDQIEKL